MPAWRMSDFANDLLDSMRPAPRFGPKHAEPRVAQGVAGACVDGRLWTEDDEPEALLLGELHQAHDVGGGDGHVAGHAPGAAVAGRTEDTLDQLGLHAFPHERVLAGA